MKHLYTPSVKECESDIKCVHWFCMKCGCCVMPGCKHYKYHADMDMSKQSSALDTQIGGEHYKGYGAYQPFEVLAKWLTPEALKGYAKGLVIKYLVRESKKGGREDIKKAMHVLQIYLELTKEEEK